MRVCVLIAVMLAAVAAARPVSTQAPLTLAALLDRYEEGRFDEALRTVSNLTQIQAENLRSTLMTNGRMWIDAPGQSRLDRLAVTALFALETEALWAERGGWPASTASVCAGRCVVEWACALLHERGATPDTFERAWLAASLSLASGARDWAFLHTPLVVVDPFGKGQGHVNHALARFPGDAGFQFVRALAVAARFETTTEQSAPSEGLRQPVPPSGVAALALDRPLAAATGRARPTAAERRETQRVLTLAELNTLSSDAVIGARARTRLAYLHWAAGDYESALTTAQAADGQTTDADTRYLARYIAGLAAQSNGTLLVAESWFEAALEARPHSQSASIALAALRFQRGDAAGAYALAQASLLHRKDDDDPWRLFPYGDYVTLPSQIQALRQTLLSQRTR